VITDHAGLRPYETDGLTAIREMPWVVVLPETEAQVAEVVRCCAQHGVPVIARGAGTGLSGGARPHAQGVVLGLSKMSAIEKIDIENRVAIVQPGVRNLAYQPSSSAVWPLLRTGPFVPNRLQYWWQRGGKRWWRALP
jgi:glycolate oxidase